MGDTINVHHVEMNYEVIDCDDKIVVLRPPALLDTRKYKALKAVSEYMKNDCGAREVITIPDFINFEVGNIEQAINILDRTMESINKIKNRLQNEDK